MTNQNLFLRLQVRFSLKNSSLLFSAIRMRIRIDGNRLTYYLPVTYKIKPRYWDAETGYAIVDPKKNSDIKKNPTLRQTLYNTNNEIDRTAEAFIKVVEDAKLQGEVITNDEIKERMDKALGRIKDIKEDDKTESPSDNFDLGFSLSNIEKSDNGLMPLTDFVDYYIGLCRVGAVSSMRGTKFSEGTVRNYMSCKAAFERYSLDRGVTITLNTFTIDVYNDFVQFLNTSKHARGRYTLNVIGKIVKDLRTILKYAHDHFYTTNDVARRRDFKVFQTTVQTVYLNEEELLKLINLELPKNQAEVRDCFIVSCYTGLRYSDLERLSVRHIDWETNTIKITTVKTGAQVVVPIHPIVKQIFERHDNKPPRVQSNQSTNRLLKKICKKAGIDQPVTVVEIRGGESIEITRAKYSMVSSHSARRSFCTNAYKSGIPTLSIMKLSTHTSEANFLRYIRLGQSENAEILQAHKFFQSNNN